MSQLEATAGLVGEALLDLAMNGRVWPTQGARHASMAPHGHYPAAGDDAWVAIACATETEWAGLRRAMGDPAWASDPRFASLAGRLAHRQALDDGLSGWTRGRSADEATVRCQAEGVPAAPVLGLEAHRAHPHFLARDTVVDVTHPSVGSLALYTSPIKLSATPGRIERTAPCLGEHNEAVFRSLLGLDAEEYSHLCAEGVIR
jgi:benzylsuccinate CoA-transferase BbsF subunit